MLYCAALLRVVLSICAQVCVCLNVYNFDATVSHIEANEAAIAEKEKMLMDLAPIQTPAGVSATLVHQQPASAASELEQHGYLRVKRVLSPSVSLLLLALVREQLARSIASVNAGTIEETELFGAGGPRKRFDLKLDLPHQVHATLKEAVETLHSLLQTLLGPEPELTELSAVVALPGATRQIVHADVLTKGTSISAFCALQDVDDKMGPTVFLPGAFRQLMDFERYDERQLGDRVLPKANSRLLRTHTRYLGVMEQGDITLYDQNILHAGTANNSSRSRALFVFSFARKQGVRKNHGASSLKKALRHRYTLSDFVHRPPHCVCRPPRCPQNFSVDVLHDKYKYEKLD